MASNTSSSYFFPTSISRHFRFFLFLSVCATLIMFPGCASAAKIRNGADPSVIKLGNNFYSVESAEGGGIFVRESSTLEGLGAEGVKRERVWVAGPGVVEIWAPDMSTYHNRTYIHFSAGRGAAHRMYVISADSPLGPYSSEFQLALPDNQWAIDGTFFVFEGQAWLVWSGWESETRNTEQTLYICRMDNPSQPTGPRYVISQPREPWEQGDHPLVNESPQAIVDPNGQLHIVYSANGSWGSRYCLADLRLRKGGDPTHVWDWYKSNGCLFGSHQDRMMKGWDATLHIDGPGHHTFALPEGTVEQSPGGANHIPFVFHGVEKGTPYSWENRAWFTGSFVWWGSTTYSRARVPGDATNTGYSFKFFE